MNLLIVLFYFRTLTRNKCLGYITANIRAQRKVHGPFYAQSKELYRVWLDCMFRMTMEVG